LLEVFFYHLAKNMPQPIDGLFISFYTDFDRWHNDTGLDYQVPSLARNRGTLDALSNERWMKDEVDLVIDGKLYDFSRFLSWVHQGTTKDWERYDPFSMTLLSGTYYLSLLSRHGFEVRVANTAHRQKLNQLSRQYDPRFLLLSTTLMFDAVDRELVSVAVSQLRQAWPEAIVVLGGLSLVSYRKNLSPQYFRRLLLSYAADVYVVSARGETPLLQILRRRSVAEIVSGAPIANTYVSSNGHILDIGQNIEPELSMDETYIRWSSLPQVDHLYHTVHTRTARSCAFKCAFCEYPVNQGPLTLALTTTVAKELEELKALQTVRSIIFTDDTFNVPLPRFKELLHVLTKFDFEWYSFFRPQYVDAETASLMKESGCRAVFAGLESVDEAVLKNMNKVATVDHYRRGIEHLKKHGISVHANFIVGFPGETETSARKISCFIDEMGIDFCTVCTWAYIPSTPVETRKVEFGIQGCGLNWKHNTMTSAEAECIARQVVNDQRSAVHNAVRGEAWTEFLLYSNGLSTDEARRTISTFNTFLGRDVSTDEIIASPLYKDLKVILDRHPMPEPSQA
jgi:anaerobic magnesium-protoporphyrin IX monomethyl ester cyclase